ncbi:Endonuclease/Exonuclease/phosphatase family protein [Phycisphaerae bacterium RAS1]|nr:Endonuclease/Exonuclease/phosphatase family protein [Phycisphaerae bacterium RAS1]
MRISASIVSRALVLLVPLAVASAPTVRFMSFNVESYNSPGSASYNALVRLVYSMDPDILLIQEASDDAGRTAFQTEFAAAYPFRQLGAADGGGIRQHTFSRWALSAPANIFAGGFSRPTIRCEVDFDPNRPGAEFRVYNCHWKSGSASTDFQLRAAMAAAIRTDIENLWNVRQDFRIILGGDLNEEVGEPDIAQVYFPQFNMNYVNRVDPFTGNNATRLSSGRSIDHFIVSDTAFARVQTAFIYNSDTYDPTPPPPALASDSLIASDHLSVVMDMDMEYFLLGDLNDDGEVNVLDINPFTLVLAAPNSYRLQYPWVDVEAVADINLDGNVDVLDINPFIALLAGP